jgi:two-component system, NtrC family, sensor kinase
LDEVDQTLKRYRDQVASEKRADPLISDHGREEETLRKIEKQLALIRQANRDEDWMLDNVKVVWLDVELEKLQNFAIELPGHLHSKLIGFADEVRGQYRVLILTAWMATVSACLIFLLFMRLSYRWIFRPLQTLIAGSRCVAAGGFGYRIRLDTDDEMAELAAALNDMTARFQQIRDDLDRQVQDRTKQVVRSEQLASVGFLAAGVAHEINNPLASIAMCAESLEGRMRTALNQSDPQQTVVGNYLRMIQSEAFRCKGITEKLLDFSRIGPGKRENTELGELIRGVLEMLSHMGKYQRKRIAFAPAEAVIAAVNPQEIKQVVLNLLTNALDNLDDGGTVQVHVEARGGYAVLSVVDDGCGMEPDVLEHVFEPFFTRRRGGQGIGLGLSITYRIIADHGGDIEAASAGAGKGSTFRVRLPLTASQKETDHRSQAA